MVLYEKCVLFLFDEFILDTSICGGVPCVYNIINSIGKHEIMRILDEISYDNAQLLYNKLNRFADFYTEKYNELCDCWPVETRKGATLN